LFAGRKKNLPQPLLGTGGELRIALSDLVFCPSNFKLGSDLQKNLPTYWVKEGSSGSPPF